MSEASGSRSVTRPLSARPAHPRLHSASSLQNQPGACSQARRLHTKHYTFGWNTSLNNARINNRILARLFMAIIYHIPDSWLHYFFLIAWQRHATCCNLVREHVLQNTVGLNSYQGLSTCANFLLVYLLLRVASLVKLKCQLEKRLHTAERPGCDFSPTTFCKAWERNESASGKKKCGKKCEVCNCPWPLLSKAID